MIYTGAISEAVAFAVETHEIRQKQKRKGKDIPYVTHPLTVGLILARVGADEDTIVAGILHDTIEDSVGSHKISQATLERRFGKRVGDLVLSVTETDKALPWPERKRKALEHIATFSRQSLLLKSADVIANAVELVDDHEAEGEAVFRRFNAPKADLIANYLRVIVAIARAWPENPLRGDLQDVSDKLQRMEQTHA